MIAHRFVVVLALFSTACASGWTASPGMLATPRQVAAALGDPPPRGGGDAATPHLEPPDHPRTCCAFGMDLHVDFAGIAVPIFEVGNVVTDEGLGEHRYSLPMGNLEVEGNGLVYTCRGGWIDTAHVRENADIQLFLALSMARTLAEGARIVIPGHGAETILVVDPIEESLLAREGPLAIASALAAWATYRISIWHEVTTWYGYEMIGGFSEQPSAFSPEDLYSNALGIRLANALIDAGEFDTDAEYDAAIDAFLVQALRSLGAQPEDRARAIMTALDGRRWDSTQRLPENALVLRRRFPDAETTVRPWRADDAFDADTQPVVLTEVCGEARARPLVVRDRIGDTAIRELVHLSFVPEGWADESFPYPESATPNDAGRRVVSESDLDALVATTHDAMAGAMSEGFDAPR